MAMPDEVLQCCPNWRAVRHVASINRPRRFAYSQLSGMVERSRRVDAHRMTNNKQLVEAFIQELFSKGDLDAVDRYLDPRFINHDLPFPGAPDGREGMRQAASMFH